MPIQDLTPQLRTRLRKVEWITGLFLGLTGLLMVVGFLYFLHTTATKRGWFLTSVPYYTYMSDATGVRPGTPVKMMGFDVGEVYWVDPIDQALRESWDYYQTNEYNVFVAFKVNAPYFGYLGADSKVRIGGFPIDLAGGVFLELRPSSVTSLVTAAKLPNGQWGVLSEKYAYTPASNLIQYLPITNDNRGVKNGYYLELDQSETLLAQSQRILKNADEISAFLRIELPKVTAEAVLTLNSARETVKGLTNDVVLTLQTARMSVASLTNDLGGLLANARRITGQVGDVIPGLTNDIAATLTASRRLMSTMDEQLPQIAGNLNLTLTNLNILLLRDTNITANTSVLVSNINNLITRHWFLRSAFKVKSDSDGRSASQPRFQGNLRNPGRQ